MKLAPHWLDTAPPFAGGADVVIVGGGLIGLAAAQSLQMSVGPGRRMAQVVAGEASANPWREPDWSAIPAHFGEPWFLPVVGAYHRVQDALH
jgi:cation diffusion facilitator CzcD-associated flavoprotein CzcO